MLLPLHFWYPKSHDSLNQKKPHSTKKQFGRGSFSHQFPVYRCGFGVRVYFSIMLIQRDIIAESIYRNAISQFSSNIGKISGIGIIRGCIKQIFISRICSNRNGVTIPQYRRKGFMQTRSHSPTEATGRATRQSLYAVPWRRGAVNKNEFPFPGSSFLSNTHTRNKFIRFLYISMIPLQFIKPKPLPYSLQFFRSAASFMPIARANSIYLFTNDMRQISSAESPLPHFLLTEISTYASVACAYVLTVPLRRHFSSAGIFF